MDWTKATARRDKKHLSFRIWSVLYKRFDGIISNIFSWVAALGTQLTVELIGFVDASWPHMQHTDLTGIPGSGGKWTAVDWLAHVADVDNVISLK